jgi:hypothetical protein
MKPLFSCRDREEGIVVATRGQGHGPWRPFAEVAPNRLQRALGRVLANDRPARLTPQVVATCSIAPVRHRWNARLRHAPPGNPLFFVCPQRVSRSFGDAAIRDSGAPCSMPDTRPNVSPNAREGC